MEQSNRQSFLFSKKIEIFNKIKIMMVLAFLAIIPLHVQAYVHPNQAGHKGGNTLDAGSGTQVVTSTYYGNTGDFTEQGVIFSVDKDGKNAGAIHGFKGYPSDGSYPWYTTPQQASDGSLYGVGFIGGENNLGATYKFDAATCENSVIRDNGGFTDFNNTNNDSVGNYANQNELSDGKLYYADSYGGKYGYGSIVRSNKDGSDEEVIHSFTYGSTLAEDVNNSNFTNAVRTHITDLGFTINETVSYDGGWPYGFVVEGSDGRVYGTTLAGGYFTGGTVFSMNKDGSDYKIIYMGDAYTQSDYYKDGTGATIPTAIPSYYFWGNVVEGSDGKIYMSSYVGGTANLGATSRIDKDGSNYQILHSATTAEGSTPYRGPLIIDDKLYQTYFTGAKGYGSIARMNYDGTGYENLYEFPLDLSEGGQPRGGLAYDGSFLYGTTIFGGGAGTVGTLYKVKPDGSEFETIHRFSNVAADGCGSKPGMFNWFPSSERVTFANVNASCAKTCNTDSCEEVSTCGNGIVESGESCDDGNIISGDGCSAICIVEISPVVGNEDNITAVAGTIVTINILENDVNTSGDFNASSVKILDLNDNPVTTLEVPNEGIWTVNSDGTITFAPVSGFTSNPTPIEYTVEDVNGNVTKPTTVNINYTTGLGAPEITSMDKNTSDDVITSDNTPEINGTCEAGNTVTVQIDGIDIAPTALCQADGTFSMTPTIVIPDGEHKVTATQTDGTNTSPVSPTDTLDINTTTSPVCGNGILETTEGCDDGNTEAGDDCSATCKIETTSPGTACNIDANGSTGNNSCASGLCDSETNTCIDIPTAPAPDYTPTTTVYGGVVEGPGVHNFAFDIKVREIDNGTYDASNPLILTIPKNNALNVSYDSSLTTFKGQTVQNSDWSFDDSDSFEYTLTYTGSNFPSGGTSIFGFNGTITVAVGEVGKFLLEATIKRGTGGDSNIDNNSDRDTLQKRLP